MLQIPIHLGNISPFQLKQWQENKWAYKGIS